MLTWICPACNREVPPSLTECPACKDHGSLTPAPTEYPNPDPVWTERELRKHREFEEALAASPPPLVTWVLLGINVAVFAAMVIRGVSFTNPTPDSLLRWGADFGPRVTGGQWWRLITAAFVHVGIQHLLLNMLVLLSIGIFTEKLFGRVAFTVLYLLAAVGGSLASLAWRPVTVSAGASGAIFGLYGGLLAFLLMQRNTVPRARLTSILKSAALFIVINLAYGAFKENVDVADHIGGFAAGFLAGCGLALPLLPVNSGLRLRRSLMVALAGVALSVGLAARIPPVDDWRAEVRDLAALETKENAAYNAAVGSWRSKQTTPAEFARVIDQQILPPWNAQRDRFRKLRLPPKERALANSLVSYMSQRAESWSLMGAGIANSDRAMVRKALMLQAQASASLKQAFQAPQPASPPR